MFGVIGEISSSFNYRNPLLIAQVANLALAVGLAIFAALAILRRGKGLEVPVWLLLCLLIPIVLPVLALIHFRKSKFIGASEAVSRGNV